MRSIGRVICPHFAGYGEQLLVDDVGALEEAERLEIPEPTLRLFETWSDLSVPDALAWSREILLSRHPVLERASFDDRVYWKVRLARYPSAQLLREPCFGADGISLGTAELPAPLDWLARTFGTVDVVAEQSGTAPWGETLKARRSRASMSSFVEEAQPTLPVESDAWVALYEADGDVAYADLTTGAVRWVGGEWTGDCATVLPVSWHAVMHFVLWRSLDGGFVRPSDFEMLAAASR